jgi:ATP-binding cassette, subfamily B, multidrug efflux pump
MSNDEKENIKILKDRTLFIRLIKEGKPLWYFFAFAMIAILIAMYCKALRPKIISNAIDMYLEGFQNGVIIPSQAKEGLKKTGKLILILLIIELSFSCVRNFLLTYTSRKIIYHLRQRLFNHVQKLPLSYFNKTPVGVVVTRVTNDPFALNQLFNIILIGFMQNLVYMIFILYMMFISDIKLSFISIALMPIIMLITILFKNKSRKIHREIRNKVAALNAFLSENISGMKITKVFNMQDKKNNDFDKTAKDLYESGMHMVIILGLFQPIINIIKYMTLTILLWFAGLQYMSNAIEIGIVYLFISYIGELFRPIMQLAEQFNALQASFASGEKIYTLLDRKKEPDAEKKYDFKNIKGEIKFNNVWFAYEDENWILKDVSFTINPNESVAFVGHTGAGKTTIVSLLCGFYEIQKGSITIDGIDISTIRKKDYRHHIGLVLQDIQLTSGDIYSNIKLNDASIPDKRVHEVTEFLQADSFINDLEDGYRHKINQGGTVLSTGQRQLISFARALVYDPKILIMDEATSNIDTQTEAIIQNAMKQLMKNRTTISIAHRLSTIQQSDKIIVMHNGEIRETGNHQNLLNKNGLYYKLYELQYKNINDH